MNECGAKNQFTIQLLLEWWTMMGDYYYYYDFVIKFEIDLQHIGSNIFGVGHFHTETMTRRHFHSFDLIWFGLFSFSLKSNYDEQRTTAYKCQIRLLIHWMYYMKKNRKNVHSSKKATKIYYCICIKVKKVEDHLWLLRIK